MMIRLIAYEYHKNNFFHGDIKPENIFLCDNFFSYITSDVGSLLYIGEENEKKFIVTSFTEKYASKFY